MALSEVLPPSSTLNETVIELLNGTEALQPVVSLVDIATSGHVLSAFASAAKFHPWDYAAIVAYFIALIVIGVWSSKKNPSSQGESANANAYFFASRSMHWLPVGTSLFASNIGSGHFIGLAGAGAHSGLGVASFELGAMFICLLLGWLFVPVYTASGASTMPGYLRKRFGGARIRIYLSSLSLVLAIFTKASADLYSGAIFIKQSLNLDLYSSVTVLLLVSALNSIGGGLTSVMWTDAAQTVLMILGSLLLSVITLQKVGGYRQLMADFPLRSQPTEDLFVGYQCTTTGESISNCTSCSEVGPYYNHLFRPSTDHSLPWPGVLFGMTILAAWYWCTDQVIVQRALSARNVSHAKAGCLLAALLKTSSLFLVIIPGMAARVLWPNELGCSKEAVCQEICGAEQCSDLAYPFLVSRVMPIGANGLMMSVMMAALISSLTSIFTSASTIFTMDIYSHFRGRRGKGKANSTTSDTEQIIVGRLFVLALVTLSVLWIPVIEAAQSGSQFFYYIQRVTAYLAPPVCAVYVLAVFWPRVNEPGAFWGLMAGLVAGVLRFAGDFLYPEVHCGGGDQGLQQGGDSHLLKMQYLYFSVLLFVFTCLVTAFLSLLTDPIDDVHLYRLTYWSKFSADVRIDLADEEEGEEELPVVVSNGVSKKRGNSKEGFTNYSFEDDSESGKGKNEDSVVMSKGADTSLPVTTSKVPIWHRFLLIICCMTSFSSNNSSNGNNSRNSIPRKLSQTFRRPSTFVCRASQQISMNAIERAEEDARSARDDPLWQPWLNIGALLVIVIATFLFGFYA